MTTPKDMPGAASDHAQALIDPFALAFRADPYPTYRRLHEVDPIHWGPPPIPGQPGCWYVARHPDVSAILRDHRFGRELRRVVPPDAAPPPIPEPYRPFIEMATLLRRLPNLRLAVDDPPRRETIALRGLVALPLAF